MHNNIWIICDIFYCKLLNYFIMYNIKKLLMDILPLNSPSLNTLLRSAGLRSDFQVQKVFDEQNFSASYSDKSSKVITEKYDPGKKNYKQPEASYFSLVQPQFQSNTPISKKNNINNPYFDKLKLNSQKGELPGTIFNNRDLKSAQIHSPSSELIGTGYFVTIPSDNPNVLNLVPEQKQMSSKFKVYFDQTKLKGTLVNVSL